MTSALDRAVQRHVHVLAGHLSWQKLVWKDAVQLRSLSPVSARVDHSAIRALDDERPVARVPRLVVIVLLHNQVLRVEAFRVVAQVRYL